MNTDHDYADKAWLDPEDPVPGCVRVMDCAVVAGGAALVFVLWLIGVAGRAIGEWMAAWI